MRGGGAVNCLRGKKGFDLLENQPREEKGGREEKEGVVFLRGVCVTDFLALLISV